MKKKLIGIIWLMMLTGSAWSSVQENDLINLARSGVGEEVLMAYVDAAKGPYHLTTDQIIELKDLGVTTKVMTAALRHDNPQASIGEAAGEPTASTADTQNSQVSADTSAPPPAAGTAAAGKPASGAPAEGVQNVSTFYEALYPYGTWISVDGQWCWRPNAAAIDVEWAPYCSNGYWSYTDWGWTWVSNYSWGWAPFHYGRWWRHAGYGWLWRPGTQWGPAWVSWRTSNDYFGWAPLPPSARFMEHRGFFYNGRPVRGGFEFGLTMRDYNFVPSLHFGDRDLWQHTVPRASVRNFFARTTIIRDNFRFSHDRIVNQGPLRGARGVAGIGNQKIEQVTVVPQHFRQGERIHAAVQTNRELMIYKPRILNRTPETPDMIKRHYENNSHGQRHGEIFNHSTSSFNANHGSAITKAQRPYTSRGQAGWSGNHREDGGRDHR